MYFKQPFNKYLLSTYYVPGTEHTTLSKTVSVHKEMMVWKGTW